MILAAVSMIFLLEMILKRYVEVEGITSVLKSHPNECMST